MLSPELLRLALELAGLLALVALGFNLVYGVLRFLNVAHAELVVLGALLVQRLSWHVPFGAAVVLGVALSAAAGIFLGRLLFLRIRLLPRGTMLATSLGLAMVLQVVYSTVTKQASISFRPPPAALGPVRFEWQGHAFLALVVLGVAASLTVWLRTTRLGRSIRAVADNPLIAECWGLPVKSAFDAVFGISTALATLSGALVALHYSISFGFAFKLFVLSFSVVLLGGLGNILGGMIASVPIAIAWTLLGRLGLEPYVDAIVLFFAASAYVLLPEGMFGRRLRGV